MKKIALIIGNGTYQKKSLRLSTPVNDAKSVASKLTSLGWQIKDKKPMLDQDGVGLKKCVDEFIDTLKAERPDAALFYFSGHGLEIDDENFAVPVDFNPQSDGWHLTSLQRMVDEITPHTRVRIVILDACRDDIKTDAVLKTKAITKSITAPDGLNNLTKQVTPSLGLAAMKAADNCQSARKFDPQSASKIDPHAAYTSWL